MPFIGIGGVEKNLFLITNYISKKEDNIYICTSSRKCKNKLSSNIKIITPKRNLSDKVGIRTRYVYCLFLLYFFLIKNRNTLVFAFQANIYAILISKIFGKKVITRSNSSSEGWSKNFIKKFIYKIFLRLADQVIVNSHDFKKELDYRFNINSIVIFNPLNKSEIKKKK